MDQLSTSILQWNTQGIRTKKDELLELIQQHKSSVVAVQETRLWNDADFRLPGYTALFKHGHFNRAPHGGVALFIHSDVPCTPVSVDSTLQIVAAQVQLRTRFTVCNIYSSRSHQLSIQLLHSIYRQLPQPCLLLGDFNAYNVLWGSAVTDTRGRAVEQFIEDTGLVVLNDGTPTRIGYHSESAIDLSFCSPRLSPELQWSILNSPGDSDHCPVIIECLDRLDASDVTASWNIKKANWDLFFSSAAWQHLPDPLPNDNAIILEDLYARFDLACTEAIPRHERHKFYPKPWWTPELSQSKRGRELAYQAYRRHRSPQTLITWKRLRAEHKRNLKKSKRDSWISFVEALHFGAPSSTLYEALRKIRGRSQRKISMLQENDQQYTTIPQIANKLADTFRTVSSTANYSAQFSAHKTVQESRQLDFSTDEHAFYNRPISFSEFSYSLSCTSNTSPGIDGIYYTMIKHMPLAAQQHLLRIFNKYFIESYFPVLWNTAVIVPIPKPGKNHSSPTNYRPIALTSCICKLLERILNERLIAYLTYNNILSPIQCGYRKFRSTLDHLSRLERTVRTSFANHEQFVSVFFDLEKAYDMTWRYGIMQDLHSAGLRGLLPRYISAFLADRFFRVRVRDYVSPPMVQENGVPQGSVLSVTLFALKINGITSAIPVNPRFTASLYVDDLQVGFHHADLDVIENEMQQCLNNLNTWSQRNGFKFSPTKTRVVHFADLRGRLFPSPVLRLGNTCLQYADSVRFLGLQWDKKLTWHEHISSLKTACSKLLGLLRSISCQKWGADQYSVMKVYRMYVRSKLDYGSPIYDSASPTLLRSLDSICTDAIRIATGAFRSTPVTTLHTLANEMTLCERRDYLALRYYFKIKSHLGNPAHQALVSTRDSLLFSHRNLSLPLGLRIPRMLNKYELPNSSIMPAFSYRLHPATQPTCFLPAVPINLELSIYPKQVTPPLQYVQLFTQLLRTMYADHSELYTDGSKIDGGVGAAVIYGPTTRAASLPVEASIFSAELYAIRMALQLVIESNGIQFAVFSDSFSALRSLQNSHSSHPLVCRILHTIHSINTSGKFVSLCWVPSHVGIHGNELADRTAVAAAGRAPENIPLFYKDFYPALLHAFTNYRNRMWRTCRDKMVEVKSDVSYWIPLPNLSRREEVIVNRLRAGHCFFTHSYLMSDEFGGLPPVCELCYQSVLTVKHVFLNCVPLEPVRQRFTIFRQRNLRSILGAGISVPEVTQFLRAINLYDLI